MLKYIKTGIDLNSSDKDKIKQCTKYWIVELDETGNRRYWVIPVEKIDFKIIDSIDMDNLWGEVMHLLENDY